mgnify:CR=1 FL=1
MTELDGFISRINLNGKTYEYEYFIEDGKIRLEEVINKNYKR